MTNPEPHRFVGFHLKPWIILLGLVAFALAMIVGLLRTADTVGEEAVYVPPIRLSGHVAGAVETASVTIIVDDRERPATFVVEITEPLSVYNLFRVAALSTALAPIVDTSQGRATLRSVQGTAATSWEVTVNGERVASLDDHQVEPGDTVSLQPAT